MQYILRPSEMRAADAYAIEKLAIPSLVLMENAARSAAEIMSRIFDERGLVMPRISILCGCGNNGGDGFAIARHLAERCRPEVLYWGDAARMSPETATNFAILPRLGIKTSHVTKASEVEELLSRSDCIVDALLGIGGDEHPRGLLLPLLQAVAGRDCLKIAVDVPTGFNAATGLAHESCFEADYTITMAATKTGMLLNEGPEKCGAIHVAPIGIPAELLPLLSSVRVLERKDVREWLPIRPRRSSKFDYGRVAVIGGSQNMPGAICLSANACIAAGAGIVKLYTPEPHPFIRPEIMVTKLPASSTGTIATEAMEVLQAACEESTVIIFGPGMGTDPATIEMMQKVLLDHAGEKTIVVDADGLRAVPAEGAIGRNVILTPHLGEFSRLTTLKREEIAPASFERAHEFAAARECVVLLKDVPTIISDGASSFFNTGGNSGMATPGSGDVLSGIIGALAAQGLEALPAAALGAYLHSAAGDRYTAHHNQESLRAGDLIEGLAYCIPGENEV